MAFGLALAGGGIRGAAHIGVLLALEEAGMKPEAIAGTSAGGIVAGLYAAGLTPKRLSEIVLELVHTGAALADPDLTGMLTLVPELLARQRGACSGLLKGNKMENYLSGLTENITVREASMRLFIPAVDLFTGRTVVFTNSLAGVRPIGGVKWNAGVKLCEAMRATSAIPGVFQPKMLENMCLVDGGVTDILPVDLLLAAGSPPVLAVDVAESYKMPDRITLPEVVSHSFSIMETRLRQCVTRGEKLLLKPDLPETSGVLNLKQMPACMEAGYRSAKAALPQIQRIFS